MFRGFLEFTRKGANKRAKLRAPTSFYIENLDKIDIDFPNPE